MKNRLIKTTSLRLLASSACMAVILAAGCDSTGEEFALAITTEQPTCQVTKNSNQQVNEVLELVNEERLLRGMNPLDLNDELSRFGAEYACEMIEKGFFGHIHPTTGEGFEERVLNSPYSCYTAVGENLARGQSSPEVIFEAWMNSPDHLENILTDEYMEMGLAVREHDGLIYWVQLFLGEKSQYGDCKEDDSALDDPGNLTGGLNSVPPLPTTSGDSPTATTTPPNDPPIITTPESGDRNVGESE